MQLRKHFFGCRGKRAGETDRMGDRISSKSRSWLALAFLLLGTLALPACFGERIPSKPLVILDYHDRASRAAILVRDLGLSVRIRPPDEMPHSANATASVWVGSKFPPDKAVAAVMAARPYYKQVRYFALSDRLPNVPEAIHHQIFIGGSTETALRMGLIAWKEEDFAKFEKMTDQKELHDFIKARYGDKPFLKPLSRD